MDRNKSKFHNQFYYPNNPSHSHSLQAIKYNKRNKKSSVHHSRQNNDSKTRLNVDQKYRKKGKDQLDSQTEKKFTDTSILSKGSGQQKPTVLGTSITMKNLRIINHHLTSAKNSIQNTSRGTHNNTALSYRALKQLVYHSNNKQPPKKISLEVNNTFMEQQNISNNYTTRERQGEEKLFDDFLEWKKEKDEPNPDSTKKFSKRKSNNQKKSSQYKIVQEFSPPRKDTQKQSQEHQEELLLESSMRQKLKSDMNRLQQSLTSPTLNFMHTGPQQDELTHKLKQFSNQSATKVNKCVLSDSKQIQSWHDIMLMKNIQSANNSQEISTLKDRYQFPEEMEIIKSRQSQKIFQLEQCTSAIENLKFKYPEISPHWEAVIPLENQQPHLEKQSKFYQNNLEELQKQSSRLQYRLFQYSREHLISKKQKQFTQRNNKVILIQQAQKLQEDLRLKICSKADFQHIILFNQRVVLSGKDRERSPRLIYKEMFENSCTRKFVMIAKKQLTNLSQYDSRLILDFFKKIQDLETAYQKHLKNQSILTGRNVQNEFEDGLQEIVEHIQSYVIRIESIKGKLDSVNKRLQNLKDRKSRHLQAIDSHLKMLANKISVEYKVQEGKSYNFEEMLHQKYEQQFQKYKKLLGQKETIISILKGLQNDLFINEPIKQEHRHPQKQAQEQEPEFSYDI